MQGNQYIYMLYLQFTRKIWLHKCLALIKFVGFNRHRWCSWKIGDYNVLYPQNCLFTVTNFYNSNCMIQVVSKNKKTLQAEMKFTG